MTTNCGFCWGLRRDIPMSFMIWRRIFVMVVLSRRRTLVGSVECTQRSRCCLEGLMAVVTGTALREGGKEHGRRRPKKERKKKNETSSPPPETMELLGGADESLVIIGDSSLPYAPLSPHRLRAMCRPCSGIC